MFLRLQEKSLTVLPDAAWLWQVRVPLCELDILEGVAGAMQHLQELMPPAPEGDVSMLPREALAGLSSVRLTLPQLKACGPPPQRTSAQLKAPYPTACCRHALGS